MEFQKAMKTLPEVKCPYVFRFELSLAMMVDMEEVRNVRRIVETLEQSFGDIMEFMYYCGLGPHIIRVRLKEECNLTTLEDWLDTLLDTDISGIKSIKKVFQDKITDFVHVGHTKDSTVDSQMAEYGGIYKGELTRKDPNPPKEKGGNQKEKEAESEPYYSELIIRTEGSDLLNVLGLNDVDPERTIVNDLPEVYRVLGVEAARQLLISEMRNTLPSDGLNARHFELLADVMMSSPSRGKMIAINRHGMRTTNTGVLAQASFEQPAEAFLLAAAYSIYDNGQTTSAAVTLGSEMRHGTGSFQLLLDTNALPDYPDSDHPWRKVRH